MVGIPVTSGISIKAYEKILTWNEYPLLDDMTAENISIISVRTYLAYVTRCIQNCNSSKDLDILRQWDDEAVMWGIRVIPKPSNSKTLSPLEQHRQRQINKFRPIGTSVPSSHEQLDKLRSAVNEIVKRWNIRFQAVRDRRQEISAFIELSGRFISEVPQPGAKKTDQMGRYCCDEEAEDVKANLFRQSGKCSEAYKWFFDLDKKEEERARGISQLNAVQKLLTITFAPGAKALLLSYARTVPEQRDGPVGISVQKKDNEPGCFGVHGDLLVFLNRLIAKIDISRKDGTDSKPFIPARTGYDLT